MPETLRKEGGTLAIEAVNVSRAYDGKTVLEKVSLRLEKGERLCVTGPSGRGKTTLLRLLCGLEKPDGGEVILPEGTRFGAVFQENRLIEDMSALGNVALVTSRPAAEIREALRALGLEEEDRPVRGFSGGMKRRVALCRALLADCDFLLLDEPYKGLDEATKAAVIAECGKRIGGRGAILVTHDPREAEGWKRFEL